MLYLFGCNSGSNLWSNLINSKYSPKELSRLLKQEGLEDLAVFNTCHRWECYWYDQDLNKTKRIKSVIREYLFSKQELAAEDFYLKLGPAAINHLFRVSSGLDSLIVGEHEILGQVRDCLKEALELRTVGTVVGTLLREAIRIGKKVRNQTEISKGKVSYASLIFDLIEKNSWLHPLTEVLIIGTGKLAKGVAELLTKKGITPYFVAGRDPDKAAELAKNFTGKWLPPEQLSESLHRFPLVIGASKANRILIQNEALTTVTGRQMMIDLSVPSIIDSEVNRFKNIEYIGLDIVEWMIQENLQHRRAEIEEAELLVAQAVEEMVVSLRQRQHQTRIYQAQDQLYQEGQSGLCKLLAEVKDETIKKEIIQQWNEQLKKLIYLSVSFEKNERLQETSTAENTFFPMILSMVNRQIVVVGGGKVAARKVSKLLEAKAEITVVAPEIDPELRELHRIQKLHWQKCRFSPEQLAGFDLVIAATDDHQINLEIVTAAHNRKILVNSVDEAIHSDFLFPAIIRRGDLLIAISTSGKRPALARKIRQELEFLFGQEYGELLKDN